MKGLEGQSSADGVPEAPHRVNAPVHKVPAGISLAVAVAALLAASCDQEISPSPSSDTHTLSPDLLYEWSYPATPSWYNGAALIFHGDASKDPFEVTIVNNRKPFSGIVKLTISEANQVVDLAALDLQEGDTVSISTDEDIHVKTPPYRTKPETATQIDSSEF